MPYNVEKRDVTQPERPVRAPGKPGAKPRWSSGAKTAIGTAVTLNSRIWFTISSGTIDELYFPDVDQANTRSIRFLIADGVSFFSDERTDASHEVTSLGEGIPGYRIVTTCHANRYRITKTVLSDPVRDCLLMRVEFEALQDMFALQLYLLIDPQLGDEGRNNSAWIGAYKKIPMLFAGHGNTSLASVCSAPFRGMTCGYVGKSAGYEDVRDHGRLTNFYTQAKNGNVILCAEIDWQNANGAFVVSVAFGEQPAEAAQQAYAGVLQNFDNALVQFTEGWKLEQKRYLDIGNHGAHSKMYRISTAVLQSHESKRFPGSFVASLSIPWGFAKDDKDVGGYHVVWPRDMVETAMGKLAFGDAEAARRALFYLTCTQEQSGEWSQNMWLDGTTHWGAVQMDSIAMPILLADQLRRRGELSGQDPWPMIRNAASFLVSHGPSTQQDRWEAIAGYSVFTMACEVAALLAAADFADEKEEQEAAHFLRETADAWNEAIDSYAYVEGTDLAKQYEVEGFYIRIAPPSVIGNIPLKRLWIKMPNRIFGDRSRRAVDIISPDALALVRFGLRSANDPRIVQTVRMLDATLRREMKTGPGWVRSTHDGYGEHRNGDPFDGRGIGRCWPLLAGERGHYELAAGNRVEAERLLDTIAAQTSQSGMIPEQVWDAEDLAEHELFNGKPTGSGMPLAWAHAEYIKLLRSIEEDHVWDMPPQTVARYLESQHSSPFQIWTEHEPRQWVSLGKSLRIDLCDAAEVYWSLDGGAERRTATNAPILGLHSAHLSLPKEAWKKLHLDIRQESNRRSFRLRSR